MALLRLAALAHALAPAALAAPSALRGEEVHCIRDRAHLVRFDVAGEPNDGSSLQGVERAVISVEPSPRHAAHCRSELGTTPSGDSHFCYGVNQDSDCTSMKGVLPIVDGFTCTNCFVAATGDASYKLNYSMTTLHSVSIGLQNIRLRAAAGIHGVASRSGQVMGDLTFPGSDEPLTLIDRLVGCPVCVRVTIRIGAPTTLAYDLSWSGAVDAEAGTALDLDLGNDSMHYDKEAGWVHESQYPEVVAVKPTLAVKANAAADLKLRLRTSLQVSVNDIMWYHLTLDPSLPMKVAFSGDVGPSKKAKVCLDGGAAFNMTQEADLDWNLLKWHAKYHWGPNRLYSWSKDRIVHKCVEKATANASLLVV